VDSPEVDVIELFVLVADGEVKIKAVNLLSYVSIGQCGLVNSPTSNLVINIF
jgi:hypothetical protein